MSSQATSKALPILIGLVACCCVSSVVAGGLWAGNVFCDTTNPDDQAVGMNCASVYERSPAPGPAPKSPAPAPAPATLTPLQTLLASAKAIQVAAVDPSTLSGTWGAAITPTDPTGPTIKYSFTMDVSLPDTWSSLAGSTFPVFAHAGSPAFYINNGGGAGASWGADATNGVCIYQDTIGASTDPEVGNRLYQVYRNSFTPGQGYKNITFVCDGTYVKYYVNGVEDTNIADAARRTNTTGVKWTPGAWAWTGMVEAQGTGRKPAGSKIRNFYWWSNKALSADERTTLLGNAATAGSLGASTYMPEPYTVEKDFAGY